MASPCLLTNIFAMKKFLSFSLALLFMIQNAQASFVIPLPKGKHYISNDTMGHEHYQPWDDYSLDFQAAHISSQEDTTITETRCWSYGAPILASQAGTISEVIHVATRHSQTAGYGAHVRLNHEDGSTGIYAHMINDSNKIYVKKGDRVEQGQILGLMGDTGNVSGNTPCLQDNNYGTHLHYELRNHDEDPNFGNAKETITSNTRPIDKDQLYANHHFGKYPYIPEIEQVHSVNPLSISPGSRTTFVFKGKYFYPDSDFTLPFCTSQSFSYIDQNTAEISCEVTKNTSSYSVTFPNYSQPDGQLKAQFEIGTSAGSPRIDSIQYLLPKPGEMFTLNINGSELDAGLEFSIQARSDSSTTGSCDFDKQFAELSPNTIKARCRLPLQLGPVEQRNDQVFDLLIKDQGKTLHQEQFSINYGISSPVLSPLQASYEVPTRFSITGKNVHRSSIFYIENCKDLRVIEQFSNKVTFECFITPKNEQSASHQFFFKTRSRYNEQGQDELTDEEDKANIILSGYITMVHDLETRIDSISPSVGIIGEETLFTVTGNRLPYSDDHIPLIWMEDCTGGGKNGMVEVIPESYTPNHFQFRCTPQFKAEEAQAYLKLEQSYNTDDKQKKQQLWPAFEQFFAELPARRLQVKHPNKTLLDETEVRFTSALYQLIQEEEQFQWQYLRDDGLYQISGPAEISQIKLGSITHGHRHQSISITGENLPYDLSILSDDCAQVAISYGSSEHFEAICLLKKVAIEQLQVINEKTQELIDTKQSRLIEIYDILASWEDQEQVQLDIRGVHLLDTLEITSPDCQEVLFSKAPSSSQLFMSCQVIHGDFTQLEQIKVKVSTPDGVTLWNKSIPIEKKPIAYNQWLKAKVSRHSELDEGILADSSLQLPASSDLFPDIHSPVLREAVTSLTRQGYHFGDEQNRFHAEAPYIAQTRREFISELVQSLPYYLEPVDHQAALDQFQDLTPDSPNLSEITFALLNGIIPKATRFHPEDQISNADAALMLYHSQQLLAFQNPSPIEERERALAKRER